MHRCCFRWEQHWRQPVYYSQTPRSQCSQLIIKYTVDSPAVNPPLIKIIMHSFIKINVESCQLNCMINWKEMVFDAVELKCIIQKDVGYLAYHCWYIWAGESKSNSWTPWLRLNVAILQHINRISAASCRINSRIKQVEMHKQHQLDSSYRG